MDVCARREREEDGGREDNDDEWVGFVVEDRIRSPWIDYQDIMSTSTKQWMFFVRWVMKPLCKSRHLRTTLYADLLQTWFV